VSNDRRFEVNVGASLDAPSASPVSDVSFTIAILGDFSARGHRGIAHASVPLGGRKAHRVDRDDVDEVLGRLAPRLHVSIDPDQPPVTIDFASLDDFHPDKLAERVPLLQQLRQLRDRYASGKGSTPPPARPDAAPNGRADAAALHLGSGSLLDRIVDNEATAAELRGLAPQDELADFVDKAVRPHLVQATSRESKEMIARIDDTLAATMRVLLHHPDFQALEALWRGGDFLVRRLDTDERLQVVLVDVTRDELSKALDAAGPLPWSLVIGAYSFGAEDVPLLVRVAAFAKAAGTPFIAGADPGLAGTGSFATDPDPDEWTLPQPAGWDDLRTASGASFLSLALPRFLLRLPYGTRTDPCELVPFEEMEGTREHESYLWGSPALVAALAIGESVAAGDPPATQGIVEGLPLHVMTVDGEPTATPVAEAVLAQRAVMHLLDRGLTPLATSRDGDAVRLSRIQSVANPPRPLSFPNQPTTN
jgi:type VI secretion system protein ImpC